MRLLHALLPGCLVEKARARARVCARARESTHAHTCTHTCAIRHTHTHTNTHTHTSTHTHAHTRARTNTHARTARSNHDPHTPPLNLNLTATPNPPHGPKASIDEAYVDIAAPAAAELSALRAGGGAGALADAARRVRARPEGRALAGDAADGFGHIRQPLAGGRGAARSLHPSFDCAPPGPPPARAGRGVQLRRGRPARPRGVLRRAARGGRARRRARARRGARRQPDGFGAPAAALPHPNFLAPPAGPRAQKTPARAPARPPFAGVQVLSKLGYTCSAGIAGCKLLAKIASARNKPNKQTVVLPRGVEALMQARRGGGSAARGPQRVPGGACSGATAAQAGAVATAAAIAGRLAGAWAGAARRALSRRGAARPPRRGHRQTPGGPPRPIPRPPRPNIPRRPRPPLPLRRACPCRR
jgi:hypothetical protein